MFGKRDVEMTPRRFWTWFTAEAQGIANAFEALSRGEADADWALDALNRRIHRFNASLEADVVRSLDGQCHLTLSGDEKAVHHLLAEAPILRGWRFTPAADLADRRRIPFRLAPRPSLDVVPQPLQAAYEAYA